MAEEEKMSEVTKVIFAFVGIMLIGFLIVGTSGLSEKQQQDNAGMMHYSNLSRMSTIKCPKAIKKHLNAAVATILQIAKTDSDKQTYFKVDYQKTDVFETASCTIDQFGVLTKMTIDGEAIISK